MQRRCRWQHRVRAGALPVRAVADAGRPAASVRGALHGQHGKGCGATAPPVLVGAVPCTVAAAAVTATLMATGANGANGGNSRNRRE